MNKSLLLVLFFLSLAVAFDSQPSRLFKERVRSQPEEVATRAPANEEHDHDHEYEHPTDHAEQDLPRKSDAVMGSMDSMASLARVQKNQAETFRLWSSQFGVFKNTVMKFMEQTSNVLQSNDKKIRTLQRVVRKIAADIDEQ